MRTRTLTPATVISIAALLFSLTGSAVAGVLITGADVKNGTLTGLDVHDGSLRSGDVKNGTLLPVDFKGGVLPVGPQGPAGQDGPQGQVGPVGPKGPKGATGSKGATGAKGSTGSQGPQGLPGLSGLQIVTGESLTDSSPWRTASAACPNGKRAVGGGALAFDGGFPDEVAIVGSFPTTGGWNAIANEVVPKAGKWKLTAYVVCATVAA